MRDWIRLRDVPLRTECDETPSGDDLHPRADIKPASGEAVETMTKAGGR